MNVPEMKRRASGIQRNRRRIVTVIGSGRSADAHSAEVGRLIATLGVDLLTGGGSGVMEATSRAFFETSPRQGIVIGVLPGKVRSLRELEERSATDVAYELASGYPNAWVELGIYTHLPDSGVEGTLGSSRNHINVLSADAVVALPGREGTESEVWLATQYNVPVIAYGAYRDNRVPHGIPHAPTLDALREFLVRHLTN
ncbi:MAG: molybdenum cofactor carrier protein [Acidobacteria bacterium]|nr:MAG: molybdenum cofactor carrier protein [Acidobacteriota bacterium]